MHRLHHLFFEKTLAASSTTVEIHVTYVYALLAKPDVRCRRASPVCLSYFCENIPCFSPAPAWFHRLIITRTRCVLLRISKFITRANFAPLCVLSIHVPHFVPLPPPQKLSPRTKFRRFVRLRVDVTTPTRLGTRTKDALASKEWVRGKPHVKGRRKGLVRTSAPLETREQASSFHKHRVAGLPHHTPHQRPKPSSYLVPADPSQPSGSPSDLTASANTPLAR